MADNVRPSNEPNPRLPNVGTETERDFLEHQLAEHARLKKIIVFFRKKDDLDANIYQVVEYILSIEPSNDATPLEIRDVSDMIHSFCQLDEVLNPQSFRQTPLPSVCFTFVWTCILQTLCWRTSYRPYE